VTAVADGQRGARVPKRSGRISEAAGGPSTGLEAAFNRIANLLALLLVKGESETEVVKSNETVGIRNL
jgi:hypothetical protein